MNASELLANLERSGVHLTASGEKLLLDAPKGSITLTLLGQIKELKDELITLITRVSGTIGGIEKQSTENSTFESIARSPFDPVPLDDPFIVANERCWSEITDSVRYHLEWPRSFPNPCLCCGGRYKHGKACEMMRENGLGLNC